MGLSTDIHTITFQCGGGGECTRIETLGYFIFLRQRGKNIWRGDDMVDGSRITGQQQKSLNVDSKIR